MHDGRMYPHRPMDAARLRADGLNVPVFRQAKDAAGGWVDAPTAAQTETDLENAILTRARQLRLSNIKG